MRLLCGLGLALCVNIGVAEGLPEDQQADKFFQWCAANPGNTAYCQGYYNGMSDATLMNNQLRAVENRLCPDQYKKGEMVDAWNRLHALGYHKQEGVKIKDWFGAVLSYIWRCRSI